MMTSAEKLTPYSKVIGALTGSVIGLIADQTIDLGDWAPLAVSLLSAVGTFVSPANASAAKVTR